jgi:hypothetical protein
MHIFNRKAVATPSPGLPLRLPWVNEGEGIQPQRGCVCLVERCRKDDATALRLDLSSVFPIVAARRGNPRPESQPRWGKEKRKDIRVSTQSLQSCGVSA